MQFSSSRVLFFASLKNNWLFLFFLPFYIIVASIFTQTTYYQYNNNCSSNSCLKNWQLWRHSESVGPAKITDFSVALRHHLVATLPTGYALETTNISSGSFRKFKGFYPMSLSHAAKFHQNRSISFWVILLTNK